MSIYLGIDIGTSGTKTLAMNARGKILAQATAMFARSPSLEDIVDRAHAMLLDAIGARLCPVPVRIS